jgi:transcriptional regulator NrdR family protein
MSRTPHGSEKVQCPSCGAWHTLVMDSRGPLRLRMCDCGKRLLTREVLEDADYPKHTITAATITK